MYVEAAQVGGQHVGGRWEGISLRQLEEQSDETPGAAESQAGHVSMASDGASSRRLSAAWVMATDAGFSLMLHPGTSGQLGAFPPQACIRDGNADLIHHANPSQVRSRSRQRTGAGLGLHAMPAQPTSGDRRACSICSRTQAEVPSHAQPAVRK